MGKGHSNSEKLHDVSIYLPEVVTLINKKIMTPFDTFFEFELENRRLGHLPGQFVEISIPGIGEAPFFISSPPSKNKSFETVIRKTGTLTNAIHALETGDKVGVRGPYGTPLPMKDLRGKNLLFIAGGLGLVVTRSVICYALQHRNNYQRISILYGCQDPVQRLFKDELVEWKHRNDIEFYETVDTTDLSKYLELTHMDVSYRGPADDGRTVEWHENIGVITTLFPKLNNLNPQETVAFVVGPPVMYKYVILYLHDLGFLDRHIIVSLERRVKCGLGKCGHCQMGKIYVCQDGPLFYYSDINHIREAF